MTYAQFWYEDCEIVKFYRAADKLATQRKNQELWLQGQYIYEGFSVVLSNAFAKRGAPKAEYPEKPYELDVPKTEDEIEAKEKAKSDEIRAKLEAWAAQVNIAHQNERR